MSYIYESPDKGQTIYRREIGKIEKELYRIYSSTEDEHLIEILEEARWLQIRRMAKTNPALQEALDRVKVLYELSKNER